MSRRKDEAKIKAIAEAVADGQNWYWGAPCKYGHDGRRYVRNGICVICQLEYCKNWNVVNRVKVSVTGKLKRKNDPIKFREQCWKRQNILSAKNYPDYLKWEEFLEKYHEQGGKCVACKTFLDVNNGLQCVADHCKETDIFRRVLCRRCNKDEGTVVSLRGQWFIEDNARQLARAKVIIASMEFDP